MDPVFTTGAVALGLGATALWLGLRAQDFRAQLRANEEDLAMMARELKSSEVTANNLREQSRALTVSIADQAREKGRMRETQEQLEAQLQELGGERDRLTSQLRRLRGLETQLSELRRHLADEDAAHEVTRAERDRRAEQLHALAAQHRELRAERQRVAAALESLCPGASEAAGDPVAPKRRAASRAALTDLLLDGPAQAAALASPGGLVQLVAGDRDMAARASALNALLAGASERASAALGGPSERLRVSTPRQSLDLLRLSETLSLVAAGDTPASTLALRRAALRLSGLPAEAAAARRMERLPWARPADHPLEGLLRDWVERWDARAVAILDDAQAWHAGTAPQEPGAFQGALSGLLPILQRFQRDGWDASSLELQLAHASGACLHYRATRSSGALYHVLVSAPQPLSEMAGEELIGVVRWHASALHAKAAG